MNLPPVPHKSDIFTDSEIRAYGEACARAALEEAAKRIRKEIERDAPDFDNALILAALIVEQMEKEIKHD